MGLFTCQEISALKVPAVADEGIALCLQTRQHLDLLCLYRQTSRFHSGGLQPITKKFAADRMCIELMKRSLGYSGIKKGQ
jgi:hypothetical protein